MFLTSLVLCYILPLHKVMRSVFCLIGVIVNLKNSPINEFFTIEVLQN